MADRDSKKILELAEKFTKLTLGVHEVKGKCFSISYPLSLYLESNQIKNSLTQGHYKDIRYSHFWLTLESEKEIILDPTRKQFYPNAPIVYKGKKPEDYHLSEEQVFEKWIHGVYDLWVNPFRYPEHFKHLDLNAFLEINLNAAIIVNNEYEKRAFDYNYSLKSKLYFYGIFEILHNCHDTLTKFEGIIGFSNLMAKFLKHDPIPR